METQETFIYNFLNKMKKKEIEKMNAKIKELTAEEMKELALKKVETVKKGKKESKYQKQLQEIKPYIEVFIEKEVPLTKISRSIKEDFGLDIKAYHIKTFIKDNFEEYYKKKFEKEK